MTAKAMNWRTVQFPLLTVLLTSFLLAERAECSPLLTEDLSPARLSPRASSTKDSRRDRKIIVAVCVIFGVFLIIFLSCKCCCASRAHGRNCAVHSRRCNANLAGHEMCGQPSQAHACTCGALEWNRQLEAQREARRNKGKRDIAGATVNETELQEQYHNLDIAPPPYTPPVNDFGIGHMRAPEPAVLSPNVREFGDGVVDGRQPSSAPELTQSKN